MYHFHFYFQYLGTVASMYWMSKEYWLYWLHELTTAIMLWFQGEAGLYNSVVEFLPSLCKPWVQSAGPLPDVLFFYSLLIVQAKDES